MNNTTIMEMTIPGIRSSPGSPTPRSSPVPRSPRAPEPKAPGSYPAPGVTFVTYSTRVSLGKRGFRAVGVG
jgi:hypothetical protein